jgi:hypothetical protein
VLSYNRAGSGNHAIKLRIEADPFGRSCGRREPGHEKKNIGSTLNSFLREEGLYERVSAAAIKRVVARQVKAAKQTIPCPR